MSTFESGYKVLWPKKDYAEMTIDELSYSLCDKGKVDLCSCIDCDHKCPAGKRTIELLESETKSPVKIMTRKQISDMRKRIEAMQNYLDAASASDPVAYVKDTYHMDDKQAKMKIYAWRSHYGTNLGMISNKILDIKNEISASEAQMDKDPPKQRKPKSNEKDREIPGDEKMPSRRQQDKISKSHLEDMRHELEEECINLDKQIEEHRKGIDNCEKRIAEITLKINAIRAVLNIFDEKDAMYV